MYCTHEYERVAVSISAYIRKDGIDRSGETDTFSELSVL